MAYQLHTLTGGSNPSRDSLFREQIERLLLTDGPRFRRLWAYYRNPMRPCGVPVDEQGSERPYRQAQEWGLPSRITGLRSGIEVFNGSPVDGVARKEVVVENDIGWRIDTLTILFQFMERRGKPKKQKKQPRKQKPKPYPLKP
jgi:hypothetical protein